MMNVIFNPNKERNIKYVFHKDEYFQKIFRSHSPLKHPNYKYLHEYIIYNLIEYTNKSSLSMFLSSPISKD
jgi:hypothetical protein